MQFIKNLWKAQPNTVLGIGAAAVMLGGFGALSYLGGSRVLQKCNEGEMLSCYDVADNLQKEITNPKWVNKMQKIEENKKLEAKQKEEERNQKFCY